MDWVAVASEAAAVVLAAVILAVAGWIGRSIQGLRGELSAFREASDSRLDEVEKKMVEVEELARHRVIDRLGQVEVALAAAVTQTELERIHKRISDRARESAAIRSEVSGVAGEVRAIHQSVTTIVSHLIDHGGAAA